MKSGDKQPCHIHYQG